MIIENKPELGLQKHQQDAYEAVKKAYENGNTASVVIPTGCGKSFIALQLMADNKDKNMLFLAPTNAIRNQMYNYIAKYIANEEPTEKKTAKMIAKEYFPHLEIILYPTLLRLNDEKLEKLDADIIIMDELHRTGADKWGERVNTLIEKNSKAKVLGLTATPDRMDDKNVVDELFNGKIDYELTLVDALRDRIVKSPEYVKCDYALGEQLEGIKKAIDNCNDEQTKKELQEKYNKMRKIVDQADGIPELFAKNIKKKDGKYIVFCKDKEHMDELMQKAKEWFKDVDSEPEMYSVYSGEGYSEKQNSETIKNFENSKSEHIKLLFSIEMLNEGLHVEDISGVIMARPTDSRIIYLQQLGRALSSDTTREKTIVFDLVNNYLKNNLDAEINSRENNNEQINTNVERSINENSNNIDDIDIFRIKGETKEFLDLLNEVQEITNRGEYLIKARAIKEWMEKKGSTKPPSAKSNDMEEKRLGSALQNIKGVFIKSFKSLKTEEERQIFRKKHSEIDEVIEIVKCIDINGSPYLINAREIKEWMIIDESKNKYKKPPSSSAKDEEEKKLGTALVNIKRVLIKLFKDLKTEEERQSFREEYPEIDEVIEIVKWIDINGSPYLINAREIKEWMENNKTTIPPTASAKDEKVRKLGKALARTREKLINPFEFLKTEEEKDAFREKYPEIDEIIEIVTWIDKNNISPYLRNAREIKEWIGKQEGDTIKMPSQTAEDTEEKRLGTALSSIREKLIKPYLRLKTEEEREKFREKYSELDEVVEIIYEVDMKCGNEKQKELSTLIKEDLDKRKALEEAKKLEKEYEEQLLQKNEKENKDFNKREDN